MCEKDKISCPAFVEKKSVNDSPNISRHLELIENSIIYDSKNFIVINKPPNFAVHGGSGLNFGVIELIKKFINIQMITSLPIVLTNLQVAA